MEALLKRYLSRAIRFRRYEVAARICKYLETTISVSMESKADFGWEWAEIEADMQTIDKLMEEYKTNN